jgi:hypothetical protein
MDSSKEMILGPNVASLESFVPRLLPLAVLFSISRWKLSVNAWGLPGDLYTSHMASLILILLNIPIVHYRHRVDARARV